MDEQWRPIEGQSGYEVSNLGRVQRSGRIRALTPDGNGYLRVSFWQDGKAVKIAVHVLVAEAFLGRRPPGLVVRHGDGVNSNNRADNLSWGTQAENEADKDAVGTKVNGTKHHSNKLSEHDVLEIRARHALGGRSASLRAIGYDYGVSFKTVDAIVKRETWKHVA